MDRFISNIVMEALFPNEDPTMPKWEKHYEKMAYSGNLQEAISCLITAINMQDPDPDPLLSLFLLPSVVINGVLDCKVEKPSGAAVDLLHHAIRAGVYLFSNYQINGSNNESSKQYEKLEAKIEQVDENLLFVDVSQQPSLSKWRSYHPRLSNISAQQLRFKLCEVGGKEYPLILIGIGHGGTLPALDIFTRYLKLSKNPDSQLYIIRHSIRSQKQRHDDFLYNPDRFDTKKLTEIGSGKYVCLTDNDSFSGMSMRTVKEGIESLFHTGAIPLVNIAFPEEFQFENAIYATTR
jgi:hypothetical protein